MDAKVKHLEFIQTTINRMAGNSFLLKGWAVTLTGGLLALTFKEVDRRYLIISGLVIALFWLLDAYYLSRERSFIKLYDEVRKRSGESTDFSMDAKGFRSRYGFLRCAVSITIILFYGGLAAVHVLISRYLK